MVRQIGGFEDGGRKELPLFDHFVPGTKRLSLEI